MADTGDIPNNIALGASQTVRRNATDTGFEAFTPEAGGDISGSTGSTDNAVIRADGVGGSTIQSSLATIDDSGGVNIPTGQEYKVNNAQHTHVEADLVLSDVTTDNATTSAHGFLTKLSGSASQYLGGDGNFYDIPTVLSAFLDDAASDISGYKTLVTTVPAGGEANVSASITGAATLVKAFALVANVFDFISTQVMHVHFHAEKTAGVKGVNAFARVYHRTSGGTETLIGTSEVTGAITSKTDFNVDVPVTDTVFSATDRLVIKLLGNPTGSGTDPTLVIYYQGTTASRVEIGTTPIASGGGHVIQDEGTPLTQRANLNFVGAGVTATDDSGNNATVITIPGGSGVTRSGSTTDAHLAVWNGSDADSIKDGGAVPSGGAPTTTPYVTIAADAGLSAEVVIPGLAGSADIAGAAGAGTSEEYDTTTTGLSWTSAPTTVDSDTTIKSHLYIADTSNTRKFGYKAWSPAGAYDVRAKVTVGNSVNNQNVEIGIFVCDSGTPITNGVMLVLVFDSAARTYSVIAYTCAATTFTQRGSTYNVGKNEIYLRITRDGSNNNSFYFSSNGLLWQLVATQALTFTVADMGVEVAGGNVAARYGAVDWLRTSV